VPTGKAERNKFKKMYLSRGLGKISPRGEGQGFQAKIARGSSVLAFIVFLLTSFSKICQRWAVSYPLCAFMFVIASLFLFVFVYFQYDNWD
jgi:hypothetical protein